jgi:hypothetical protein
MSKLVRRNNARMIELYLHSRESRNFSSVEYPQDTESTSGDAIVPEARIATEKRLAVFPEAPSYCETQYAVFSLLGVGHNIEAQVPSKVCLTHMPQLYVHSKPIHFQSKFCKSNVVDEPYASTSF